MHEVLLSLGFILLHANNCLYILCEKGQIMIIVIIYVDDMLIASASTAQIISFKKDINRHFKIMDLDEIYYVLGLQIKQD